MKISVVAGTAKLHLFGTIRELHEQDSLGIAYVPLGLNLSKTNPFRRIKLIDRAANRYPELETIPKVQVIVPEFFYQLGLWMSRNNLKAPGDFATEVSHRLYSLIVNQRIKKDDADVFIIRCGFGNHIDTLGKLRVCDLSMAHPYVDLSLTSGKGMALASHKEMNRVAKLMVADLAKADRVIVNSEFVKRTCVLAGIEPSKISVAYLPPAHELLDIARKMNIVKSKPNEMQLILFVGTFSERKGIDLVLKVAKICISRELQFKFILIGSWSGVSANFKNKLLAMRNIEIIPWATRDELAEHYARANFLFCPTRADGGARVITESMLFGDVVITTTVSGSPITSGSDGFELELTHDDSFVNDVLDILQNEKITKEVGKRAIRTASVDLSFNNYMKNILNCCEVNKRYF